MITVINKTNKGLYNQLFAEVEDWLRTHNGDGNKIYDDEGNLIPDVLGGPEPLLGNIEVEDPETGEMVEVPDSITSLGELFTFMEFITKHAPIYTRLPLDEEPFFIDANKRSITVPKDFVANGVSVQGDEIAEILFFKINRFFDATDLSQCNIYIQWRSSEVDDNGNPVEGLSRTWIQDIDSEPGYLIFGWPISSKITKAAGNVTFSVRFYRFNSTDDLIYSFSTLDQTVKILPALDYDIDDIQATANKYVIDDCAQDIRDRAINSPSSGSEAPMLPEWDTNQLGLFNAGIPVRDADNNIKFYVVNLAEDESHFYNDPLFYHMSATSDDSGIVSYSWVKKDKNGNAVRNNEPETHFYEAVDYIETHDETRLPNKTYYYLDGQVYKVLPLGVALNDENYDTIYELVSTVTVATAGTYTPYAQNRVGKYMSERIDAIPLKVPVPAEPEISDLGPINGSTQPILGTDPLYLGLDVAITDEYGNELPIRLATYEWKRQALSGGDFETIDECTELPLVLHEGDENAEGYYQIVVTNNLNREVAKTESNIVRVTKPAVKLQLDIDTYQNISIEAARNRDGYLAVSVEGQEPNRTEEDAITYQWYAYSSDGHDAQIDTDKAKIGEYIPTVNDTAINDTFTTDLDAIRTATLPNFRPPVETGERTYFCLVTNHYNGTETSVASPFYHVIP